MKKKIITALLSFSLILALLLCGCVNEKMSNQIQEKIDAGNYTYTQLIKDYGSATYDSTLNYGTTLGTVIYAEGCKNWDEVEKKLDNGKTVKGVYITIGLNKVLTVQYRELTKDDDSQKSN